MAPNPTGDLTRDLPAALTSAVVARYAASPRFARGYVAGKLRHDPASAAILQAGAARHLGAVVDLGCGCGQLGIALLLAGVATSAIGLERDPAKLAEATRAAYGLPARFIAADLAVAEPPSGDTLLLIDVLYQMPEAAQHRLLRLAAAAARRRVLIRAFDPGLGWRSAVGLAMERAGRALRRDGAAIRPLPLPAITGPLRAAGFTVSVVPCWGRTPLPNVLVVAERDPA